MARKVMIVFGVILGALILAIGVRTYFRYLKFDTMQIPVGEVTMSEYPEDPANRSVQYGKYASRMLKLVKKAPTLFDFIFYSDDPTVATIILKDIDIGLFVPVAPKWTRNDADLEVIALVDREWNRQQVSFPPSSQHVEILGGDGFETNQLYSMALARNCLNAGLWELLLFTKEEGEKVLYYQGWFTFPLGHYKDIFEEMNQKSYWSHWYRLEHWVDPSGRAINLAKLRTVTGEREVNALRLPEEHLIVAGEQKRKARIMEAKNVKCWDDFCKSSNIYFASFIPPGRYSVKHPWKHEYERIAYLEKAYLRKIQCPSHDDPTYELELLFRSSVNGKLNRFIVGGVNLKSLPQLPIENYPEGFYMPMGIAVPPFYQSYEELKKDIPFYSPYYNLLIDAEDRWIDHHKAAVDGSVLHRDIDNPDILHLYLLSYERHSLVAHFVIPL